ncbi:MAG: hypothetical protein KDD73_09335 [Anaerolineales bacterium]|nr:hypothetical protein [Anaerolineales bacterium]MCB9127494.1 hypothetical protein [Ardenticatenales bacterium]
MVTKTVRRMMTLTLILLLATVVLVNKEVAAESPTVDCDAQPWVVGDETALNEAIACYNAKTMAGSYVIDLVTDVALTMSTTPINNPAPDITLTINGGDHMVDGQGINGVQPLRIESDTTVTISHITITGGNVIADNGGAIFNDGTLNLQSSTISGNSVTGEGGGIFTFGSLNVENSLISDNLAGNVGGGISSRGVTTITDSTISGNVADSVGGVLGSATITNSIISNNSAVDGSGGGLAGSGLTIVDSRISGNSASEGGGGFYFISFDVGITIRNSLISENTANLGGGIYIEYFLPESGAKKPQVVVIVENSTISGNTATIGGGIHSSGNIAVESSTLSNNSADSAGGIYLLSQMTLQNSIVANSVSGGDCVVDGGSFIDEGHNLIEDGSCITAASSIAGDPVLGPLADNGGPTHTHALLDGSPAHNAGETDLTADQRGLARPQGSADDMGAYEYGEVTALTLGAISSVPSHGESWWLLAAALGVFASMAWRRQVRR